MNQKELLLKVAAGKLSVDDGLALMHKGRDLYCKVSQKAALSVYGLGRLPVTLYVEQWERLLDFADDIRKFAEDNAGQLSRKKKQAQQ